MGNLASRAPMAKECADCGLRGLLIGVRYLAISRLRTPSITHVVGGFGICARSGAELTPQELRGPI
eukprot:7035990-Alexandrium_andersonii.AAC.1